MCRGISQLAYRSWRLIPHDKMEHRFGVKTPVSHFACYWSDQARFVVVHRQYHFNVRLEQPHACGYLWGKRQMSHFSSIRSLRTFFPRVKVIVSSRVNTTFNLNVLTLDHLADKTSLAARLTAMVERCVPFLSLRSRKRHANPSWCVARANEMCGIAVFSVGCLLVFFFASQVHFLAEGIYFDHRVPIFYGVMVLWFHAP